jgi:hypothetical protein
MGLDNREFAVASGWLFRHVVPGGYIMTVAPAMTHSTHIPMFFILPLCLSGCVREHTCAGIIDSSSHSSEMTFRRVVNLILDSRMAFCMEVQLKMVARLPHDKKCGSHCNSHHNDVATRHHMPEKPPGGCRWLPQTL